MLTKARIDLFREIHGEIREESERIRGRYKALYLECDKVGSWAKSDIHMMRASDYEGPSLEDEAVYYRRYQQGGDLSWSFPIRYLYEEHWEREVRDEWAADMAMRERWRVEELERDKGARRARCLELLEEFPELIGAGGGDGE